MLAVCLTARRYLHSTKHFYCQFKFNEEQTKIILSVVNSSTVEELTDRFGLTKRRANKLHIGLQQISQSVTSIDELLTISGLNENVLNKFFSKILNDSDFTDGENKTKAPRINLFTTPKIPDNVISQIKTFTAIQNGLAGLAWCTFELNPNGMTNITHWDWRPLPDTQKINLHLMASFVSNALKAVPQSDFYVFESPLAANIGSPQKVSINVQLTSIIGMASILVAQRSTIVDEVDSIDDKAINNVVYLKKYLYARLFQLYLGTEQVSSSTYVETMLRWKHISTVTNDNVQSLVQVDDDLKSEYMKSPTHVREFLCCTLLTGLAFLRLNILKCPQSHAILNQKFKKKK